MVTPGNIRQIASRVSDDSVGFGIFRGRDGYVWGGRRGVEAVINTSEAWMLLRLGVGGWGDLLRAAGLGDSTPGRARGDATS